MVVMEYRNVGYIMTFTCFLKRNILVLKTDLEGKSSPSACSMYILDLLPL